MSSKQLAARTQVHQWAFNTAILYKTAKENTNFSIYGKHEELGFGPKQRNKKRGSRGSLAVCEGSQEQQREQQSFSLELQTGRNRESRAPQVFLTFSNHVPVEKAEAGMVQRLQGT